MRCVQLLHDLEEAEAEASKAAVEPRGTIRVTAPMTFGVRHLAPQLAGFLAAHPGVKFDVQLSDRLVDLVKEGFDLGIRIGGTGGENLVPCASPEYLERRGAPKTPADLAHHNCFTYEYAEPRGQWRFVDAKGAEHKVRVAGTLHTNNGDLLADAAVPGIEIVCEPDFVVGPEIGAGRLVPVPKDYSIPPLPIYAVYPMRRHLLAKVRVFLDSLTERMSGSSGRGIS